MFPGEVAAMLANPELNPLIDNWMVEKDGGRRPSKIEASYGSGPWETLGGEI